MQGMPLTLWPHTFELVPVTHLSPEQWPRLTLLCADPLLLHSLPEANVCYAAQGSLRQSFYLFDLEVGHPMGQHYLARWLQQAESIPAQKS